MDMMTTMDIYTISDELLDELYESYKRYLTDPFSLERQSTMWKVGYFLGNTDMDVEPQPIKGRKNMIFAKPQINESRVHFKVLIHMLVNSSFEDYHGMIKLNSKILYKLDKNYKLKLDVLLFSGFIIKDFDYSGEYAKNIFFINSLAEIHIEKTGNIKVIRALNQVQSELEKYQGERLELLAMRTSKSFVNSYNRSLKEFRINDQVASEYISEYISNNRSKLYYTKIVDNFQMIRYNKIINFDDNDRYYHIGTMLPRVLKKYTNITNVIDAKNSHPYLFNHFILNYYFNKSHIDNSSNHYNLYYQISLFFHNYIITSSNNFNIRKDLCNCLKNMNISIENIETIKRINVDVLRYMLRTSRGQLWTQLVEKSEGRYTLDELKGEMFKKLFYNKQLRIDKNIDPLVLFFRQEYPTVYQILLTHKRELRAALKDSPDKKREVKHEHHLANKLMRLESQIFLSALTTIYYTSSKHKCVHIHDAIAIIDNTVDVEYVKSVLNEKYKAFGLLPTFSVD